MRKSTSVVGRIYRSFMLVSIMTALTATLGMFIDNVIVGRYLGAEALGALGAVGPLSLILSALGNICSSGGAARAAQALGRGEKTQVNTVFTIAVLFALVSGFVLTVVGMLFAPRIALLLGAKEGLHDLAVAYLLGFLPGAVPTIMTTVLMSFIKIDGSPKLPLVCIGVMSITNIALDLVTIIWLDMGMFGAGLATSASYLMAALAGCLHFSKKHASLRLVRPRALLKELRAIVITGAPTALSRICDTIKVTILNNLLVIAGGAAAVAVLNVRTQTCNLVGALLMGVSQALVPVAGMFYGEGDASALRSTLRQALRSGLLMSAVAALLLGIFPSFFAELLGVRDPASLAMASNAIRLFAIALPLQMLNMVAMSFYQTTRSTGAATLVCVLQQLVFTACFALLLIHPLGVDGVWLSFLLAEIGTLLVVLVMICLRKRSLPRQLTDVMLLPADFGGDADARLTLSICNNMEDVMNAVQQAYAFGQQRGLSPELMHRAALCIEEMAGNVVQHASRPNEQEQMDLLIQDTPDALIIRLRDGRGMFDPLAYLSSCAAAQQHLGLRIVSGVTDNMAYARTIGLNSLRMVLNKKEI